MKESKVYSLSLGPQRTQGDQNLFSIKNTLFLSLFLLLFFPATPGLAAGTKASNILHRGNSTEPVTLDPHQSEDVSSGNILRDLFEGLVTEDAAGNLIPGAAEKWTISEDGLTYTFKLRTCLAWSNGEALSAADFIFSLRHALDPDTAAPMASLLLPIKNAREVMNSNMPVEKLGIEMPDAHTLIIKLEQPTPWFLQILSHPIAFPVYATSLIKDKDKAFSAGNTISNGAWTLQQWVPYEKLVLNRNTHYYNQKTLFFKQVVYYPIETSNTEFSRYRAGELDWTDTIPPNKLGWIKKNLPGEAFISLYLGTYYYGFNLTHKPFKGNTDLRQALSLSIDRAIIAEKILGNGEHPADRWLPAGILSGPEQSASRMGQNLKLAKQLYNKAGYSRDTPLHTTLHYNSSDQNKRIAIAIAAMWKKNLGIKVELINEEWKVFLNRRKSKTETQLYRASWIADYNDASSFLTLFTSNNARNDTGYASPVYDGLIKQIESTMDNTAREKLIRRAEQQLLDDQVIIPIYHYVSRHLVKPDIKGYKANPLDHHYSRDLYRD
ncbi:MAG: ABC transporter substrate-binding protein [Gammaproteobacteria bacterium]|nr:MAG: ABC transporter substrate-binding protein [Gammaproteobacteria bacterium]